MQTLCQRLRDVGQLGGSYFFKRDHMIRGNARGLFATLAYQLAIFDPTWKAAISNAVEQNPSLVSTSIPSQLEKLIVDPCWMVPDCPGRILLIDGLDECDGITVQQEILRAIHDIFCKHTLQLKILIASRPEPDIREMFETWSFPGLDTTNVEQSFTDVEIYLRRELTRIHWEHRAMSNVPAPWPSEDILWALVEKSSGYFVYAAIVIKFVDDKQFRPTEQLDIVLDSRSDSGDSPYNCLDALYIHILRQVPTRLGSRLLDILSVVMDGWQFSPRHMDQFLGLQDGDVELTLRKLHSLLAIDDAQLAPLTLRHASFGDFLLSASRSSEFHITEQRQLDLARSALKILSSPQLPEETHYAWRVAQFWVEYLTSKMRPSTELLTLIRKLSVFPQRYSQRHLPRPLPCAAKNSHWPIVPSSLDKVGLFDGRERRSVG
ncbi:hypothetical protein FB45DRAFT_934217 [Roridomyces roridus]|uniref:Nephrocystin 3-like N-terminal domain-containing protein n=1 Tax=Roridomyces roridus TaxID=1738132 RepID=A0AAD7FFX8_9AGAR|nr:hypothetical protein FB45DRAFT_934217 [Roridomyces roridus]